MLRSLIQCLIILAMTLGSKPGKACSEHRPEEYVVFNMQLLQVMAESYYQEHQRHYPPDLRALLADAQKHNYYRHLSNPYRDQSPHSQQLALKQGKPSGPAWKGTVGFLPLIHSGRVTGYQIYGGDIHGYPIMAGEFPLILQNTDR